MRKSAILISGREPRHDSTLDEFASYLASIDIAVSRVSLYGDPFRTRRTLENATQEGTAETTLLVAYHGHGFPWGWEVPWYFVLSARFDYSELGRLFGTYPGRLLVINDTCYGERFRRVLHRHRTPDTTGFIAGWESCGPCYATAVRDALDYWPLQKSIEDEVAHQCLSNSTGDFYYPVQVRWGTPFDHMFYPAADLATCE